MCEEACAARSMWWRKQRVQWGAKRTEARQKNSILNKPRARGGQRELSARQGGQRELSARQGETELKKKPSIRLGMRDDSSSSLHDGSPYYSSIRLRVHVWGAKRTECMARWAKRTERAAGRNWTKEETINKTGRAR
jgi:hypothetical protein